MYFLLNIILNLGPVQTSCFCCVKLNSGTASESKFSLSMAKPLSTATSAMLHDSGTAAIQMLCFCSAKLNS